MAGKVLDARFYRTAAGNEPVRDWLKGLSPADRRVVGYDIGLVEDGWPVGMPVCRSLGGGLWEVRSDISDGPHCPLDLPHPAIGHAVAARLHQEEPTDTESRFGDRREAAG